MAIIVSGKRPFRPAPVGQWRAVCVDVVELKDQQTQWGLRDKVRIVWQIEELDPQNQNKPFIVVQTYVASIGKKAALRAHLESWRGRPFTKEEVEAFDVERLIGVNAYLNIVHHTDGDNTYANLSSIMPLGRGMEKLSATADYVRFKDRPRDQPQQAHGSLPDDPFAGVEGEAPVDDSVPF